jgi:hypothetical protein
MAPPFGSRRVRFRLKDFTPAVPEALVMRLVTPNAACSFISVEGNVVTVFLERRPSWAVTAEYRTMPANRFEAVDRHFVRAYPYDAADLSVLPDRVARRLRKDRRWHVPNPTAAGSRL